MEWIIYSDSAAFAERIEPLLYKKEDEYSLFLGILGQIGAGRYEDYFLALAENGGEIVAASLMTPPHPLQLIVFVEVQSIEQDIAEHLLNLGMEIPAVVGDRKTAFRFAEVWTAKTGDQAKVLMDQGLYRADSVTRGLERSPGSWRIANKTHAELLSSWLLLFEQETGITTSTAAEASRKIDQSIEGKEVYIWEVDGEVVSCMKKSRPSKHGITVSFVFTPEHHRRKGYARTLVADVTEELLLEYDFAMLYTDLQNPTSNKIYREIGFEQIANPVHLLFEKKK